MSTGGVGVGGSEPVGTSAWTRLVIDKYIHACMLSCSLATCGIQQLSTGPDRKNKGEESLLLILSTAQSQDCPPQC